MLGTVIRTCVTVALAVLGTLFLIGAYLFWRVQVRPSAGQDWTTVLLLAGVGVMFLLVAAVGVVCTRRMGEARKAE